MNRSASKLEKIVSYCIMVILLGLGGLILAGVFSVQTKFRFIIFLIIVSYIAVRLVVMNRGSKS
ncbi:MAG TPA: hypothetical protein VGB16_04225 [candidate division Zixibacteria bacterium]